jgi:glycosyltransferase involved in cell wall biosynthesis
LKNVPTIGFNATFVQPHLDRTGQSRYSRELLRRLQTDPEFESQLIVPDPALRRFGGNKSIPEMFWELFGVSHEVKRDGISLLHNPYWTAPYLHFAPTVVTIPDLFLIAEFRPTWRQLHWKLFFDALRRISERADAIIVPSTWVKDQVSTTLGYPRERISITPLGADHLDGPIAPPFLQIGDQPYLVTVASGDPGRKNLGRILSAVERVRAAHPELQLVISGNIPRAALQETARQVLANPHDMDWVESAGAVTDAQLSRLYSDAVALVFPSLGEGFGFPIVEAMYCGCPVVTSNVTACPETAGGAAILVDPHSVPEIEAGILELLQSDDRRTALIAAGKERVRTLTWDDTWTQTKQVYRTLLDQQQ